MSRSSGTGGEGRGRFGGGHFETTGARKGVRVSRPNIWRSPLGAVAVAVAATAYWSTVAWLVAARTSTALIEVDNVGLVDELEMGLDGDDYGNDGTGRLPPVFGNQNFGDSCGEQNCPHRAWQLRDRLLDDNRLDRRGYRPFSFGLRQLGLARDLPDMTLLDRRYY
jgi:hypothetical protein